MDIFYRQKNPQLESILTYMQSNELGEIAALPCLYGASEGGRILLKPEEIFYFETVDRKVFAYLKEQVYQISQNLSELEKPFEEYGFIRINKSVIVNIYKIVKVKPEFNMRIHAVMENDELLVISRRYKSIFEKYLVNMQEMQYEKKANLF